MLVNDLLVRWSQGWAERTDAASITALGRFEATLGVGALQSLPAVYKVADAQLAVYANPRQEIMVGVEPVGDPDSPYLSYLVGDVITVPDEDGTPTDERVMAITVTVDRDTGRAIVTPQVKDVILGEQERFNQAIKKMSNGTIQGDSKVAQPVANFTINSAPNCCPPPAGGIDPT